MYCEECGAKIADTAKFCTNCGTALRRPAAPQQAAAPVFAATEPTPSEPAFAPTEVPVFEPAVSEPVFEATPAASAPTPVVPAAVPRRYRGRLIIAVLACFLLFLPTGIPAIVSAAKAIRLSDDGSATEAARYARRSTVWAVLSIAGNILWNMLGLILLVKKYS